MMEGLTEHQVEALRLYVELMTSYPQLFEGRRRRPIVRDLDTLSRYAAKYGAVLGVAAKTDHLWLINDLVTSRDRLGSALVHPYLRLISPPSLLSAMGVVVLATMPAPEPDNEQLVLIRQERHSTGTSELEFPRGFGTRESSLVDDGIRELEEETGLSGATAEVLGVTVTDSGTSASSVAYVHVIVDAVADALPETEEAIEEVVLMTRSEAWQLIDSGEIRDGFTLQALALYERRSARTPPGVASTPTRV
jgi:ADP-ribose pyrophosphatase